MIRDVHPHADADGILRDGECRSRYFRCCVETDRDPDRVLPAMFDLFNAHFFGGALPTPDFVVAHDHGYSGNLQWFDGRPAEAILFIDADVLLGGYEWARDVLLHEMCHLYVRAVLKDEDSPAHSPAWVEQADRLGVYVSEAERKGLPMVSSTTDAERIAARLLQERGIRLDPGAFALDGREELGPDHEGSILVEYGFDALVRYYCPNESRLDPSMRLP